MVVWLLFDGGVLVVDSPKSGGARWFRGWGFVTCCGRFQWSNAMKVWVAVSVVRSAVLERKWVRLLFELTVARGFAGLELNPMGFRRKSRK